MKKTIEERLKDLEQMVEVQSRQGNWDWDWYMMGMANGLILALNTVRGDVEVPPLKSKPEEWGADRYERMKAEGKLPQPFMNKQEETSK
jgi:hypothetical protein